VTNSEKKEEISDSSLMFVVLRRSKEFIGSGISIDCERKFLFLDDEIK
jgi:hypothetical protein